MEKLLKVSSSPHVRDGVTTQRLMFDVVIAMIPASVYGVWQFGMNALLVLIATVIASVAAEYLYEKLMHKPITISDGSAVVTGMILALNMPPEIPVWIPVLGAFFAIIVVKQLYGGLGQNFMNPALAARCFLLTSFALFMNNFSSAKLGFDSLTGATPLAQLRAGETVDLASLVIGRIPGTIGEVSVIALLIGAIYMVVRKVISPVIPLIYIGTVFVFTFLFGGFNLTYSLSDLCRWSYLRCILYGNRLCNESSDSEGTDRIRTDPRNRNRNLPSLGCFSGGRFLCDHLQQPAGTAD